MSNEPVPNPATPPSVATGPDKTVAILSYITLVGFIVAIVLNNGDKKNALGAFHLRQSLGIFITGIVTWIAAIILAFIPIVGWLAIIVIYLGVFALWLMGLIAAASGKTTPVPVLGASYQKWFSTAFN